MSASKTSICNMALSAIGISSYIADIEERSKSANVCRVFFDQARDAVLEQFDWDFARLTRVLALSSVEYTGWQFVYTVPVDCIKAREIINPSVRNPTSDQRIPFKMMTDTSGNKYILTDQEDAELLYTASIDNPNLYSPSFVRALSLALGALIAMPMSVSTTISDRVEKMAAAAINNAVSNSMDAEQEEVAPETDLLSARY